MLALLRKRQRVVLWIILVVIIFAFIIWGSYTGGRIQNRGPQRIAGYLGQQVISEDELAKAVRGAIVYLRLMNYPPELLTETNPEIEMEAWRRLIQLDQARKSGITVSADEVVHAIQNMLFRGSENYSIEQYRAVVKSMAGNMQLREFEEHIREILMIQRMQQLLGATVIVTDDDLREAYDTERTLVRVAYVPFFYTNFFAGQAISTNEIEEFYNANQEEFKVPPKVDLAYVLVTTAPAKVAVSDDDISVYYDENQLEFTVSNTTAALSNAVASAGAQSNALAEADTTVLPLTQVKGQIRTNLVQQRAAEIARDQVGLLFLALSGSNERDAAKRADTFRATAKEKGMAVVDTGLLALDGALPGVSNAYQVLRAAFGMKAGEVSDAIEVPGKGYLTFIVKEHKEAYMPALEDATKNVQTEIRRRRALMAARAMAEGLRQRIGMLKTNFVTAARAAGCVVSTSVPLDRNTGIEEIDCPAQVVAHLFAYPANTAVVVPFKEGYLLASPIEFLAADYSLMYEEADKLRERVASRAHNILFSSMFAQAARNVRIVRKPGQTQTTAPGPGEE